MTVMARFWRSLFLLPIAVSMVTSYRSGVPPLDRRALAGIWKLTPSVLSMKEFTVQPVKPPKKQEEVLLMLKADGSFTRYETPSDEAAEEEDVNKSWKQFVKDQRQKKGGDPTKTLFKGTWDYRDGELILAADRDEQKAKSDSTQLSGDKPQNLFWKKGKDTILVGAVVATNTAAVHSGIVPKEETLGDKDSEKAKAKPQSPSKPDLSVPMGSVQVGKFFYPKNHPSFFDQPIFQPKRFGTFQLKQVLREITDEPEEEQLMEKFRNKDFHGKKFFLTSSPIEPRRPKGNTRWSIKYNKYVEDPPSKQAKEAADAEKNRLVPIRVMKVMIHANNTFSTVAGLGDTTILRGRFNVIGDQRDQVWLQSTRFGFGRSVSGSTYSEGTAVGEEKKSYWGKISYEGDEQKDEASEAIVDEGVDGSADEEPKRLQVKGTVIVGWGLEPQPVARFIMREALDDSEFFDDCEEDEEEDEAEKNDENAGPFMDDDWSSNSDAFQ